MCFINQSGTTTPRFYIYYPDKWSGSSAAAIKAWTAENHPVITYALANPTDTKIVDTTLIDDLDALADALGCDNKTNMKVSASGLAGKLKVLAFQKDLAGISGALARK